MSQSAAIQSASSSPWPGRLRNRILLWTFLFLLLGAALRLWRFALGFPLWGDEAFIALNLEERTFDQLAQPLRHYQVAPLGFLWLEKLVTLLFGFSEAAVRLVPCLAGILALLFFFRLAKIIAPGLASLWAVAILAVSYYPIRHACEVKPYATDLLASVLFLWAGAQALKARPKPLWLLALGSPVLISLSFPAVFTALAAVLVPAVHLRQNRRVLFPAIISFLAISLSFFLHYSLVGKNQFQNEQAKHLAYWDATFPPANPLFFFPWLAQTHAGNLSAYPVGSRDGGSSLTMVLFLAGIFSLARKSKWPFLFLLLAPFFLTLLAALPGRFPYGGSARVAQHLAPSICLLAGLGLAFFLRTILVKKVFPALGIVLFLALFALGLGQAARDWLKPYKTTGDELTRSAIQTMVAKIDSGNPLQVTREAGQIDPSIEWYLRRGGNKVVFHPGEFPLEGKSPVSWFWLPPRPPGGDTSAASSPTIPEGWMLLSRQDFTFPLGRDSQSKIQFSLLTLEK
ncbi:MAG: glycosyltransferase family 39 protein [Gemmataceae bacterium]|nr:glycosyltransferase family 39 protein [Gemmataceae bacterium]